MRIKRFKRLISTIVTVSMFFSSVSFIDKLSVKAYGENSVESIYFGRYIQDKVTDVQTKKYLKKQVSPGETKTVNGVKVYCGGSYDSPVYYIEAPIQWRVLGEKDGCYILLSEKVLSNRRFINFEVDPIGWPKAAIREWLNNDFFNSAFSSNEKGDIKDTTLDNVCLNFIMGEGYFYRNESTTDKVWLLDEHDILNANYGFSSFAEASDTRLAKASQYVDDKEEYHDWYLRGEPYWFYYNEYVGKYVEKNGKLHQQGGVMDGSAGGNYDHGIRPVVCVKKNSKYLSKTKPIIKLQKDSTEKEQYSLKTEVTGKYKDGGVGKIISDTEVYDDNYFLKGNSSAINANLASLSMLASATAYKKSYAEDLIKKCGFREHHKYNSAKSNVWDANKVSFEMAYKKVHDTYIIAVWVKGSSDIFKHPEDWVSNAHLGLGKILFKNAHKGFKESEKYMNKIINSYLKNTVKLDKSGKVKIWITGHSRGAAVANLYAKRMNKKIGKANVFAYTFASPKVLNDKIKNKKKYSNIFNYVNQNDLVPTLPPGYKRYGIDKKLKVTKKNKNTTYKKMRKNFKKLTGKKYKRKSVKHTHCQTAYLAWLKAKCK